MTHPFISATSQVGTLARKQWLVKELAESLGIAHWAISLSYSGGIAMASAIASGK
jgi:hypothetical protein